MSRVKEVVEASKEVIQKLEAAMIQTANARTAYENYQKLLNEAKQIHEQKYAPLWNQVYNDEATTKQEQEQLKNLEEAVKNAWEQLGKAISELFK